MRIAWFTPFSIKSAIGKYSKIATDALINHCKVDLWLSEGDNLLDTDLEIVYYDQSPNILNELNQYDLIVFNLGDNFPYHGKIYEVSKKVKGIVILHDFIMHHFFTGYYFEHKKDTRQYIKQMEALYGEDGRKTAEDSFAGRRKPVWESDEVINYPFFEKVIEDSLGVVTHSHFLANKIKEVFLSPVEAIYFPFDPGLIACNNKRQNKEDLGIDKNKILILTIGFVNPNKRLDKIIECLGNNRDLADKINYVVIGPYDDNENFKNIRSIINKYELQDVVRFLGYQSDEVLYAYMQVTDIFINLRYPAMEGASWSLLEQLYFGKPVIVTDTGHYSELPDDCVLKVSPDYEQTELARALFRLVNNEEFRMDLGLKAEQFAAKNYNTEKYCRRFIEFAEIIISRKPIMSLIDRVTSELASMGVSEEMKVIDKAAEEIAHLSNGSLDSFLYKP